MRVNQNCQYSNMLQDEHRIFQMMCTELRLCIIIWHISLLNTRPKLRNCPKKEILCLLNCEIIPNICKRIVYSVSLSAMRKRALDIIWKKLAYTGITSVECLI